MRKSKKTVTLHDLSEKSGFSIQTISKALRGLPGMSEENRARLIKLARESGYWTKEQEHIHAMEKVQLHPSKPFRFKLVVSEVLDKNNTIVQLIWNGLRHRFAEYGHIIELVLIPYHIENRAVLPQWAEHHQVRHCDGLFITPMLGELQEQFLLEIDVPRVLINFPGHVAKVDSVCWDIGTAIHQSVRHLLDHGHTRIMYIGQVGTARGFRLRWEAFVTAMHAAGITVDPDEHMITDKIVQNQWIEIFQRKLLQGKFSAIIKAVGNVSLVYHACSSIGLHIPADISLVTVEDEINEFVPELSRPLLHVREAGIRAAERMLWRIANPGMLYEHVLLQGEFFAGNTVCPLNQEPEQTVSEAKPRA